MGIDIVNFYEDEFYNSPILDNLTFDYLFSTKGRQPGWQLLNSIVHTIWPHFNALKMVIAAILNYAMFTTIRRYSPYLFTGILMYFVMLYTYFNFEILRESIALSIFLLSLPYFDSQRWKKFYLCLVCAFLFHESSSFLVVLPLICKIGLTKRSVSIYATSVLFIMVFSSLFRWIPEAISSISYFADKAQMYMQSEKFGVYGEFSITRLFSYTLSQFLPIISTYYMKKEGRAYGLEYFIIAYVFIQVSIVFFPILMRLGNYLSIFYYIFYILLIKFITEKFFSRNCFLTTIICVAYILYTFIPRNFIPKESFGSIPEIVLYYPYTSIFDQEIVMEREVLYSIFFKRPV